MSKIPIVQHGSLWIAHVPTTYGNVELLCGEGVSPDMRTVILVERFLDCAVDYVGAIRRSAFGIPILWRPIRFAINNEGRLGLQFKHRITGRQDGMFFADELSTFSTRLADITVNEDDILHMR